LFLYQPDKVQRGDRAKSMFVAKPVSDEWADEEAGAAEEEAAFEEAAGEEEESWFDAPAPVAAAAAAASPAPAVGRLISSPAARPKQPGFAPSPLKTAHVIAAQPPPSSTMDAIARMWDDEPTPAAAAAPRVAVSSAVASIFDDEPIASSLVAAAAPREADALFGEPVSASPKPVIDFFAY
jgi:hypothetical protein